MATHREVSAARPGPIPASAGIGLRQRHIADFQDSAPPIGWVEIHSETFLAPGGPRIRALERIREDFPVSCHCVGLSLGSAGRLDRDHLRRLVALFERIEPGLVSEHVAWCSTGGTYLNDLLPLPYTEEALACLCRNIDEAQEAFGRRILVENPSTYVRFAESTMPEWEFMAETARRTGCGILLDVNNIHVSAFNHGFDPGSYLDAMPLEAIGELHIAGHFIQRFGERTILIDDHGAPVDAAVWDLFKKTLERLGPLPTLVEWDNRIPELPVLLAEAAKAQRLLDAVGRRPGRDARNAA
jgi:uncharacterized protein (UPF0276 family)